jgi:hypothetical protein
MSPPFGRDNTRLTFNPSPLVLCSHASVHPVFAQNASAPLRLPSRRERRLEYRIHFGPDYRVYFGHDGERPAILRTSGTKQRQQREIEAGNRAVGGLSAQQARPGLKEEKMLLTRRSKELGAAAGGKQSRQRAELLRKGTDSVLAGDIDTGKAILRDYIKPTIMVREAGRGNRYAQSPDLHVRAARQPAG